MFLNAFSSCQPDLMSKVLNEFHATGPHDISHLDIKELASQLDSRVRPLLTNSFPQRSSDENQSGSVNSLKSLVNASDTPSD